MWLRLFVRIPTHRSTPTTVILGRFGFIKWVLNCSFVKVVLVGNFLIIKKFLADVLVKAVELWRVSSKPLGLLVANIMLVWNN
jgi:hypothetical protein